MTRSSDAKARGTAHYAAKRYAEAVECFGEAINNVGPQDDAELHVYYSNRCAALQQLNRWKEALDDAEAATSMKPGWAKGYARLGACLRRHARRNEAAAAYAKAAELEPGNATYARDARSFGGGSGGGFAADDTIVGTLVKAATQVELWFRGLDTVGKACVVLGAFCAFYFGLLAVKALVFGLKRAGVGGPKARGRGMPPPQASSSSSYGGAPPPGKACCDKYGRATYGGTYDQFGRPAAGHEAYDDGRGAYEPPPQSSSSYGGGYGGGGGGGYGGGHGGSSGGMGMMGIGALMLAAWKLPPFFGHQPFFGMSPMTFMWLAQMLQGNRGGRRRMPMGMGGMGGLGGLFNRRRF